jgi:small subunit ribosomal protein S16
MEGRKALLKIRLRRMGAKQRPYYRVVVSDSRATPRSRSVDVLGVYDPGTNPVTARIDRARAEEWLRKGAHASDTVRSLLARTTTPATGSGS